MNKLVQTLGNTTLTENGAVTNKSTTSPLLDFFGLGAALRTRTEVDIVALFEKAFNESELLALKTLFYIRDVRGGQGERRTFRIILKWLANNHPNIVKKNFLNVPEYGRFDDLLVLLDTPLKDHLLDYIDEKLSEDVTAERPSLLAKWLPSINTSSKETVAQARVIAKRLGLNEKTYRKTLAKLRKKLDVVERKMCANKWTSIKYQNVPSRASTIYRKAFARHDQDGYTEFLQKVEKGEAKINAATLYPYDIVGRISNGEDDKTLDLQWKALPDYLAENPHKGIVVADTSGSMMGLPINVSVSLAIYFAERNVGPFKDVFLTFSSSPTFHTLNGRTISEKVKNLDSGGWGQSTNLQATFELILNTAIRHKVPKKDMPEVVYIVSDMEFNYCTQGTNLDGIKEKYKAAKYKMPKLVFWNVNARNNQAPVTVDDKGTCLVSGASPSILKTVLSGKTMTPYGVMLETINAERYNAVKA
jgi:hypothetical protein